MYKFLAVAGGGGIGAALRYAVTILANHHGGMMFPYGTVLVNVVGSFLIGFLMVYFNSHMNLSASLKLFVITGILGGLTTFSTFNMELLTFIRANELSFGLLYGGLNIIGSFLFCWIGVVIGIVLY